VNRERHARHQVGLAVRTRVLHGLAQPPVLRSPARHPALQVCSRPMREKSGLDARDWVLVVIASGAAIGIGIWQPHGWLGIAGLATTVVGLAIAIGQVRLARDQIEQAVDVAEATRAAVISTRAKVVKSELIEAIGSMLQLDRELFAAAQDQDGKLVAQYLAQWRDRAYDVLALVEGTVAEGPALTDALEGSAKGAVELRNALPDEPARLKASTKKLRNEISAACGLLAGVKVKMKLDMQEGEH
jgi:hypothetical protein